DDPERTVDARAAVVADVPAGRYSPDRVVVGVGEPQGAIGPAGDPVWSVDASAGVGGGVPGRSDAPDRVVSVGEPQGAVRSTRDVPRAVDAGIEAEGRLRASC